MGGDLTNKSAILGVLTNLGKSSNNLAKSFQRLSSGLRINSASDDAAGLALSTGLKSDSKIFAQAGRNINDSISAVNMAQSAMDNLHAILQRQLELATEASNGNYTSTQRQALDTEAQALIAEYDRVVQTTSYNGIYLLNGSTSQITVQAGGSSSGTITISLPNLSVTTVSNTTTVVGSGDGSFKAGVNYSIGKDAHGTVAGDFNGDGYTDLASTNYTDSTFTVLLNNGNGTFKAGVSYAVSASPYSIESIDVNGDGELDIATSNGGSTGVSVALGNGNGTFKASTSYGTAGDSVSVSFGDLNGDGYKDIVAGSDYTHNYVGVLINNGNGTFKAEVDYTVGAVNTRANQQTIIDINGDSVLDIISTNKNNGAVGVLLGNGNGTFKVVTTYSMNANLSAQDVALVDINSDNILDIVSTDSALDIIDMRLGNGNGTFKAVTTQTVSGLITSPSLFATGDFNSDGKTDLVIEGRSSSSVRIMLSNGNGTFKTGQSFSASAALAYNTPVTGDFNGDGITDIAVAAYGTGGAGPDSVTVVLGNGTASSSTTTTSTSVLSFSLLTSGTATSAITTIQNTVTSLETSRGVVDASMSRLEAALNVADVLRENYAAASDKITDADVAEEVAAMLKNQMLQQAETALLAQANQNQSLVLKLLEP